MTQSFDTPIGSLFLILMETWEKRYEYYFDMEAQTIKFTVPGFELTVEGADSGLVKVIVEENGEVFSKASSPEEAAKHIEILLFPDENPEFYS